MDARMLATPYNGGKAQIGTMIRSNLTAVLLRRQSHSPSWPSEGRSRKCWDPRNCWLLMMPVYSPTCRTWRCIWHSMANGPLPILNQKRKNYVSFEIVIVPTDVLGRMLHPPEGEIGLSLPIGGQETVTFVFYVITYCKDTSLTTSLYHLS